MSAHVVVLKAWGPSCALGLGWIPSEGHHVILPLSPKTTAFWEVQIGQNAEKPDVRR